MSYQLRDYQTDLLDRINKSWFSGTRSLVCQLPTGGGKTILFATVVHEANQNGLKCLVLAHREELILDKRRTRWKSTNDPVGPVIIQLSDALQEIELNCPDIKVPTANETSESDTQ